MINITACIDGSAISGSVCEAAAWAGTRLDAPLTFLHVLEKPNAPAKEDLSGAIGLGSREHLLDELTLLDEKRAKLALEHGKHMLEDAKARAIALGATDVALKQRHGNLMEELVACEADARLFVMGRLGNDHDINAQAIGSHLESVVRAIHTPILVTVGEFVRPTNYMIAYDGSETANKAIKRISTSPLLKSMPGHIVMVDGDSEANRNTLQRAVDLLLDSGHQITGHLVDGVVLECLEQFRQHNNIDLLVMGAYGHSRIRDFFVGSNTSKMIGNSVIPVLLLRK
ncbi:universal stress protein [Aestuariirhabdus sp. LZHN29]|uniref:universal stress protein n=1 Tax=Aestuariirhabdus sp. LZHN29 TaxID=3417462 RepID=UPI003CE8BAED